jgi:hypothetical protein
MGAGTSKPSSFSERKKILEATKSTRDIVDIILEYLLREVHIRDLYLMASPTECKKYVIFLANTLASHFTEFRIAPGIDKKGVIAFRSIRDLAEQSESQRKETQSLCLYIAYFYIRIFQIYGAIALTLLDDASYMQEKGYSALMRDAYTKGQLPTQFRGPPGAGPQAYRAYGPTYVYSAPRYAEREKEIRGGSITTPSKLGLFIFLNPVLLESVRGFTTLTRSYKVNIKGPWTSVIFIPSEPTREKQSGIFRVNLTERTSFDINVTSRLTEAENLVLTFESINYGSGTREVKRDELLTESERFYVFEQRGDAFEYVPRTSKTLEQILLHNITKLTEFVKERMPHRGSENTQKYGYSRYNEPRREFRFEEASGVDEHLKLQKLVENLTSRHKPFGHCITRALQLLQNAPLNNHPVESHICNTKFLESRTSLPVGASIDKSLGISTLANLFYDVIDSASPSLTRSSEATTQYIAFMKQMANVFAAKSMDITSATKLSEVSTETRDKEICGTTTGPIEVPADTARQVYSVVSDLFAFQLQHASRCANILAKLFLIKKVGGAYEIHIHPNIFKNGIPEINKISEEARNILTMYYSSCETIYQSGVKVIASRVLTKKPAPVAPTAPPAPAARPRASSNPIPPTS